MKDPDVVSYTLTGTVGSPSQRVIESRTRVALQDEGTHWWHLRTKSRKARGRPLSDWEYEELNITGTSVTSEAAAVRWVVGGKL
jgi:hypothetical protein